MLALKTTRTSPIVKAVVAAKYGTVGRFSGVNCYATAPLNLTGNSSLLKATILKASDNSNFIISTATILPFAITSVRFYSAEEPKQQTSVPSPPNLPDKQQLEKYFFRTLAFIYDISYWLYLWVTTNFHKHVISNPTVQSYWKDLYSKMEKSKKN